jgi:hypothetical protein
MMIPSCAGLTRASNIGHCEAHSAEAISTNDSRRWIASALRASQ